MRFDRFMQAALHDPERGYYGGRIRTIGRNADFSTTPTLSSSLGRAVARWADLALGRSRCRNLVELGPGSGELASTVLAHLPWLRRMRTTLHLVETSAPLRKAQEQRLGKRVQWHSSIDEALDACRGRACIYSNEFVDAFPVRRFRKEAAGWSELWVTPGKFEWRACATLPRSSVFTRNWTDGQIVEVHESYHEWLHSLLEGWNAGSILTIDYGHPLESLYHRQPEGSLRGYFHHQLVTGMELLERPGHQDLTADVNFTDLIDWPAADLEAIELQSQAGFLREHVSSGSDADRFVAAAGGAGGAFQVLHQRRR